ncbi:MAG: hypothetical protein H0X40_07170 [Chthoniobacterales bacterium]|nr:hypothetical protein [Chthoniobacterales bacterium]
MPTNDRLGLEDFESGRVNPARFPHREHVRISYELLERHPFPEALLHLARGLRAFAAKAGKPAAYHETITVAFLALIAERRLSGFYRDAEDFLARNPELLRKDALSEFYDPRRINSDLARMTFILPRRRESA